MSINDMTLTADQKNLIADILFFKENWALSGFIWFTLLAFAVTIIHSLLMGNWLIPLGILIAIIGWLGVLISWGLEKWRFYIHSGSLFFALIGTVIFIAGINISSAISLAFIFGLLYFIYFFGSLLMPKERRIP